MTPVIRGISAVAAQIQQDKVSSVLNLNRVTALRDACLLDTVERVIGSGPDVRRSAPDFRLCLRTLKSAITNSSPATDRMKVGRPP